MDENLPERERKEREIKFQVWRKEYMSKEI